MASLRTLERSPFPLTTLTLPAILHRDHCILDYQRMIVFLHGFLIPQIRPLNASGIYSRSPAFGLNPRRRVSRLNQNSLSRFSFMSFPRHFSPIRVCLSYPLGTSPRSEFFSRLLRIFHREGVSPLITNYLLIIRH